MYPRLWRQACEFFEYGKEHEGYWIAEKFLAQLEIAATIAELKYSYEKGHRLYFIFDHSSYHGTFANDALCASKMNLKPGGKQPTETHDTYWKGKQQRMVLPDGTPKGIFDWKRC